MPNSARYHFLDSGRAILLLLGLPYHAGLIYAHIPRWFVLSPDRSDLLTLVCSVINSFRMPAFFMVAGFFSAMVLQRRNRWDWLRARWLRLGVPFAAGMLLIGPVQLLLLSYLVVETEEPFGHWLAAVRTPAGHKIGHLWFLPPLILLSTLTALLWPAVRGRLAGSGGVTRARIWICAAVIILWEVGLAFLNRHLPMSFAGGILSLERLLFFAPYFAIGAAVLLHAGLRDRILRFDAGFAALALGGVVLFSATWLDTRPGGQILNTIGGVLSGVFASQLFFAACKAFLDRPTAFSGYFARNSFTIYLFHQPVIICLGALMIGLSLPPVVEHAAIVLVTLAACMGICHVVNRSAVLGFLFAGVPMSPAAGRAQAGAATASKTLVQRPAASREPMTGNPNPRVSEPQVS